MREGREGDEMNVTMDLRVLQLVTARLVHELAGPVAAIGNGIELMGEDDPDFVRDAVALVGNSARTASQRLQFYRFAYGTIPGDNSPASLGRDLLQKLLEGGNVQCDWPSTQGVRPPEWQRLACNLIVLAAEGLPRGGKVILHALGERGLAVDAEGDGVRLTPEVEAALLPNASSENLTARSIHAYLCARFAAELNGRVAIARREARRLRFEVVIA